MLDSTPPATNPVSAITHEMQQSAPCIETPVTAKSLHSLSCLPDDILHAIFTYLPVYDIFDILKALPDSRPFVEHAIATRQIKLEDFPFNPICLQLLQSTATDVFLEIFITKKGETRYADEISSFRRLLSLTIYVYQEPDSLKLNINRQLETLCLNFKNFYSSVINCSVILNPIESYIMKYPGLRNFEIIDSDIPSDRLLKWFQKLDQLTYLVLKLKNSDSLISSVMHSIASLHQLRHITINLFGNSLGEWLQAINGENLEKVELFLYDFDTSVPLEWHRLQNVHTLNICFVRNCESFTDECCVGWSKLTQLRHLSLKGAHFITPKVFLTGYNTLQELKLNLQICLVDKDLPKLAKAMPALRFLDLKCICTKPSDAIQWYDTNMNDLIRALCAANRLEGLSITSDYQMYIKEDIPECLKSFTTARTRLLISTGLIPVPSKHNRRSLPF